jgi:hypothetical protein
VSVLEVVTDSRAATPALRQPCTALSPALPIVAPGQVWLVELPVGDIASSGPVRRVLDAVNVVVYDRALAEPLADVLPFGAYAEPAAAVDSDAAAAARCVRFARDGWSVARLVPAGLGQRDRTRRVRALIAELTAAKAPGGLAASVLAEIDDGICERVDTRLDRLADAVATYPRDTRLLIAVDAFAGGAAARLQAVAANGLAG